MGFIDRIKERISNLINKKPQLPENTNSQSNIQTQNLNSSSGLDTSVRPQTTHLCLAIGVPSLY